MKAPFKWIQRLGQGSFGEVWLVEKGGRRAAVKKLLHALPDHLERFAREARILWGLRGNRHVVQLIDHDLNATPPYFVMEYCEEGSLRRWVGAKQGSRFIAAVLSHVVAGLQGIHAQGGFHRDIKPENLLITRANGNYVIKVGDFGVARTPATTTNMTVSPQGTRGYMAPEIVAGHDFHAGADVFSLGVVGIELLTGQRAVASLEQVEAPAQFKNLLRRMVAVDPASRPTLADVATALREAMQPALAPAQPPAAKAGITWDDIGKFALTLMSAFAASQKDFAEFRAAALAKKPIESDKPVP